MARVNKILKMEDLWFADNDIPFNILSRLPTFTLLGLKRVSKDWQRLISEPSFIKQKLKTKEPVSGFFFQERFQWCDDDINSISFIRNPDDATPGEIRRSVFDFLQDDVVLLAVTKGVVCCRTSLSSSQPLIYVCNPSNKEWVALKWPKKADKSTAFGLAFDPFEDLVDKKTNFKIINVYQTVIDADYDDVNDDVEDSNFMFSFSVYSSKTRIWKKSKENCEFNHNLYKKKGLCVNGKALFWLTEGDKILMFDIDKDLARLFDVPVPLLGQPEICIGEAENKLHYIIISEEGILVWALEDWVGFNWELKYFVDLDEMEKENYEFLYNVRERVASRIMDTLPWIDPLAYTDEVLLMRVSEKIYLYNFDTKKMKEICNVSDLGKNSMFGPIVLPYSVSLVPFVWP